MLMNMAGSPNGIRIESKWNQNGIKMESKWPVLLQQLSGPKQSVRKAGITWQGHIW